MKTKLKLTFSFLLVLILSIQISCKSESSDNPAAPVPKVSAPTFNPVTNTEFVGSQEITLACETAGATIRYTTDGTTPSDTVGTVYTAAFTVTVNTTVKAVAYKAEMTTSDVSTANYTKAGSVANPSFTPADNTLFVGTQEITITTTTAGASIRYTTDGTTVPTSTVGTVYSAPFSVSATTTVKAIAYKSGMDNSAVTSVTVKARASAPEFSPITGTEFIASQLVTITSATAGVSFRYTTDGTTTPTSTVGTVYSAPFTITATTTIKAIAYKSGMEDSAVSTAVFTRAGMAANPVITPSDGTTFAGTQSVSITCGTTGASIRYTTDGTTTPTSTVGTIYSAPFTISATTTIKAIAYKSGLEDSAVATATINELIGDPVFSPVAGTFQVCPTITITTATSGASIKFTRDNSDPKTSPTASVYTAPITFNGTIKAYAYRGASTSNTVTGVFNVTGVVALPKTGETTSYQAGDDGSLQRGLAWPSTRFTDNGDGTITDNLTGLMWEKAPSAATYTWSNAITVRIAALNSAALGGHTDWKLPNLNELESLVHQGQANSASWLNTQGFTDIQGSFYWSGSSSALYTGNACCVSMYYGYVGSTSTAYKGYVLGVRSGQ